MAERMTTAHQSIILALALLVLFAGLSGWQLMRSRAAVLAAQTNVVECRRLANEIASLRAGSAGAATDSRVDDVVRLVRDSLDNAGLDAAIDQPFPTPTGQAGWLRETIVVDLEDITVRELISTLQSLANSARGFLVTSIGLESLPEGDRWRGDLTLTRLMRE